MNAAARLVNNHGVLSRSFLASMFLTSYHFLLLLLVVALLATSLSMVYLTNTTRSLNANFQKTLVTRDRLHVEWGQLLLERSTLTMQSRIQNIAENHLAMVFPEGKLVVVVKSPK